MYEKYKVYTGFWTKNYECFLAFLYQFFKPGLKKQRLKFLRFQPVKTRINFLLKDVVHFITIWATISASVQSLPPT